MDTLLKDIRYGIRMLLRSPGFTTAAVLSLALAIGCNTVVFSFVNAILLRSMPYENADRLVVLYETYRKEGVERRNLSYPDFVDWRAQSQLFEDMAAFASSSFTLSGEEPERISGELVSWNYFALLGLKPLIGRTFSAEEDATPDTHPVVVVSYAFWRNRLASDPSAIGKTLKLNDRVFTVIGVMPEEINGLGNEAQVWLPMMMVSSVRSAKTLATRDTRWHNAVARLKPGATIEQARSEIDSIAAQLEQQYPESNANRGGLAVSLHSELFGKVEPVLWLLIVAVAFVLLIGCTNMANLLLARATGRQKELAIRLAIGAGRKRLVQQLLTESITLATLGGALGLILTYLVLGAIKQLIPIPLPGFVKADIDLTVFAFTFLISIATGLIFGAIPAFQASRPNFNDLLKDGNRGSTEGRHRVRNVLVVSEIALTLTLLVGAGLMIKSLDRLQAISPGFNMKNLLVMNFNLSERQYKAPAVAAAPGQLAERIGQLPSVISCSLASDAPLQEDYSATSISVEGRPSMPGENEIRIFRHRVTPNYFSTMQIPVRSGRDFGSQDVADGQRVVIVSERMARKYYPNEDPIGKRIKMGALDDKGPWLNIIGVVGDVKYRNIVEADTADPDVYFPLIQSPSRTLTLVARTDIDPAALASSIRRELLNFDSNLPVYDIATMAQRMVKQTAQSRFNAMLLAAFAFIALTLAALGVYGVTNFAVKQRTQEMGIRLALGATPLAIHRLIMGHGARLAAIGLAIGLVTTFAMSGVIASLLYGISTNDPITFAGATTVLVFIVLSACYLPARRATKVDPVIALRNE